MLKNLEFTNIAKIIGGGDRTYSWDIAALKELKSFLISNLQEGNHLSRDWQPFFFSENLNAFSKDYFNESVKCAAKIVGFGEQKRISITVDNDFLKKYKIYKPEVEKTKVEKPRVEKYQDKPLIINNKEFVSHAYLSILDIKFKINLQYLYYDLKPVIVQQNKGTNDTEVLKVSLPNIGKFRNRLANNHPNDPDFKIEVLIKNKILLISLDSLSELSKKIQERKEILSTYINLNPFSRIPD